MDLHKRIVIASVIAGILLGVNACTQRREQEIPKGPQTMTGTLVPVPLSLDRRGSHIIRVQGKDMWYAESSKVNLHQYEQMEIGITGNPERNTDPDAMPVLMVTAIHQKEIPMHWVDISSLQLRLSAPRDWEIKPFDDGAQFVLTGSTTRVLQMYRSTLTQLPAGSIVNVGALRAARIDSGSGITVHVLNGRTIVTFVLTPPEDDPVYVNAFWQLLKSVSFGRTSSSASSSKSKQSGTGALTGTPFDGGFGERHRSARNCRECL